MRLKCEICGEVFEAAHLRPHGDHCVTCAGFLSVLDKGPYQQHTHENDKKFGMVVIYLIKKGYVGEGFFHGLNEGIKKT